MSEPSRRGPADVHTVWYELAGNAYPLLRISRWDMDLIFAGDHDYDIEHLVGFPQVFDDSEPMRVWPVPRADIEVKHA